MRKPPFTLEQVRSFVAVADSHQISRAATSLYLTQGAVTQQISHFEKSLGLNLLERDGRGVRLTDAGRTLTEACRAALRAAEVLDDTAQAMRELQAGSLHIGGSPTCATYYLPAQLAEFTRRHPHVKLDVLVEPTIDLNRKVVAGTLDCALIEGPPDPALNATVLTRDELVFVAHSEHPLTQLKRIGPDDLRPHRYLRRGPEWSAEHNVEEMLGPIYNELDSLNLGHIEYVRAATVAGLGFAVLPKRAVAADLASGVLKRLPLAPIVRPITAVRRNHPGGPAQEAFWALLTGSPAASKIRHDGGRARI